MISDLHDFFGRLDSFNSIHFYVDLFLVELSTLLYIQPSEIVPNTHTNAVFYVHLFSKDNHIVVSSVSVLQATTTYSHFQSPYRAKLITKVKIKWLFYCNRVDHIVCTSKINFTNFNALRTNFECTNWVYKYYCLKIKTSYRSSIFCVIRSLIFCWYLKSTCWTFSSNCSSKDNSLTFWKNVNNKYLNYFAQKCSTSLMPVVLQFDSLARHSYTA